MEKFLKVGKLNSFPILNSFNGSALLIFANNHNNYNMNVSEVSGSDALKISYTTPLGEPGKELVVDGQYSYITIQSDNIDSFNGGFREFKLTAKYGERGDKGIKGPKGDQGSKGISAMSSLTNTSNAISIINGLNSDSSTSLLSALQGNILNTFIKKHDEILISSEDYISLEVKDNNTKYYTIDELHKYSGKKYTFSGIINWDAPVIDEDIEEDKDNNIYDITVSTNGELYIGKDSGTIENNHTLVLGKNSGTIEGTTFVIKKSTISNATINDSTNTITFSNATLENNSIILPKNTTIKVENNTLILNK